MNELENLNKLSNCDRVKTILKVSCAINPQFYSKKTKEELQAESVAIEMLTNHIDDKVFSLMCNLASKSYALDKSHNPITVFNVNYILKFYRQAFNEVWMSNVELDESYVLKSSEYDGRTKILTEIYKREDETKVLKYIVPESSANKQRFENERIYSPKYWELLNADITNVDKFLNEILR